MGLVKHGIRSFTVTLVLPLIDVFHNEHIVFDLQSCGIEFLATHISNANVDALPVSRVRDASDQLWLAVEQNEFLVFDDVVESYSAHCAAVANVLVTQVNGSQRIGEPRSNESFKFHLLSIYSFLY